MNWLDQAIGAVVPGAALRRARQTTEVVPTSIRSLAVIAEPRLDPASGAVPWFLFAHPASIDTIEYAYLEGQDSVFI